MRLLEVVDGDILYVLRLKESKDVVLRTEMVQNSVKGVYADLIRWIDHRLEPSSLRMLDIGMQIVIVGGLQSMVTIEHIQAFELLEHVDDISVL